MKYTKKDLIEGEIYNFTSLGGINHYIVRWQRCHLYAPNKFFHNHIHEDFERVSRYFVTKATAEEIAHLELCEASKTYRKAPVIHKPQIINQYEIY